MPNFYRQLDATFDASAGFFATTIRRRPMAEPFRGTVHARVVKNVTLPNLTSLIEHIGGLAGCRTCGLLGVDLRITGDPVETHQVPQVPGVKSVTFGG
jgi:hypothetical protein